MENFRDNHPKFEAQNIDSYSDVLTIKIEFQSIFDNIDIIKEPLALAIIENGYSKELCKSLLLEVKPLPVAVIEKCLKLYPELYIVVTNIYLNDRVTKAIVDARNITRLISI